VVWVVDLKLVAAFMEESVLLLPILEKEENEYGGADGLLPLWRKKEELSVERVEDELVSARLGVTKSTVERECRERLVEKKKGRRLVFSDFWTRFYPLSSHQRSIYL